MEDILVEIDGNSIPAAGNLVIRSFSKRRLYKCPDESYKALVEILVGNLFYDDASVDRSLCVQWINRSSTLFHPLIFQLEIKKLSTFRGNEIPNVSNYERLDGNDKRDTRSLLLRYFDLVFLPVLEKHLSVCSPQFTAILAMRRDYSGGMHVYFPEIEISHDDYIFLCERMMPDSAFYENNLRIGLRCPSSWYLPGCGKDLSNPKDKENIFGRLYVPVRLVYVHFDPHWDKIDGLWTRWRMDCSNLDGTATTTNIRSSVTPLRRWCRLGNHDHNDEKSLFDTLLADSKKPLEGKDLARFMMPVRYTGGPRLKHSIIYYPTRIKLGSTKLSTEESVTIAVFKNYVDNLKYRIVKDNCLVPIDPQDIPGGSFARRYLERNSLHLGNSSKFRNVAYTSWLSQYDLRERDKYEGSPFEETEKRLAKICVHLKKEPSPLKAVMTYRNGLFFWPVFYSLCLYNHEQTLRDIQKLFMGDYEKYIDKKTFDNLRRTQNSVTVKSLARNMSFKTIAYCASKAQYNDPESKKFLKAIGHGWRSVFDCCIHEDEVGEVLVKMMEMYFPITSGLESEAKEEQIKFYHWDPIADKWIPFPEGSDKAHVDTKVMEDHVENVFQIVEASMDMNLTARFKAYADPRLRKEKLAVVATDLLSDIHYYAPLVSNFARFCRTENGVVDTETGFEGANVPEYYIFE